MANPNWTKGTSGNPAGRPRGFAGLASYVREKTKDGRDLVDFAIKVFTDEHGELRDRWAAHNWLADRGFGKPVTTIDLHTEVSPTEAFDPSRLTVEQLEQLEASAAAVVALLEVGAVESSDADTADQQTPADRADD